MRVLIASCALFAATNLACAADSTAGSNAPAASPVLSPTPALPYSWAGFYVDGSSNLALGKPGATTFEGLLSSPSTGSGNLSGSMTGGVVGANWQNGNTVVGFEGDMQWSDQWAAPFTDCGLGCSLNDRVKVPWLATLRARAGTSFDRLYVYGTGGFATFGASDTTNPAAANATPNFVDLSPGNINWTVGGGMEFALDQNVSAKLEYLYMPSAPVGPLNSLFDSTGNDTAKNNVVRGGINYRLPVGAW